MAGKKKLVTEKIVGFLLMTSGSVRGIIVKYEKGQSPAIIYSTERELGVYVTQYVTEFARRTWPLVREVLSDMQHVGIKQGIPEKIVAILGTPWSVSELRTVTRSGMTPITYSEAVMQAMIDEDTDDAIANYVKQTGKASEVQVFEQSLIQIFLNGYEVPDPIGKRAEEISMTTYVSFSNSTVLEKLGELVEATFHAPLSVHSLSHMTLMASRDILSGYDEFVLIHIDAMVTRLSLIRKGGVRYTHVHLEGNHHAVRKLAETLRVSGKRAESLLQFASSGSSSDATLSRVRRGLRDALASWLQGVRGALAQMSTDEPLPRSIFVIAPHSIIDVYLQLLASESYFEFTDSPADMHIEGVHTTMLGSLIQHHHTIQGRTERDLPVIFYERMVRWDE